MDITKFKERVGKKVEANMKNFSVGGQRDERGVIHTADRIMTSMENLYYGLSGTVHEPSAALYQGFSQRPGMNAVANTKGVDVVDLTILASVDSFMPYVCAERAMTKPVDILTYEKLVASNTAGGFTEGDDVVNPFTPLPNQIQLSLPESAKSGITGVGSTAAEVVTSFGAPLAKGKVEVTYNGVTGMDVKGDGNIYYAGAGVATAVDYANGTVTMDLSDSDVVSMVAKIDTTSEGSGANTLKLRPENVNIPVEAETQRIILENSVEQMAYLNKQIANLKIGGISTDYGKIALKQLFAAYLHFINTNLVTTLWNVALKQAGGTTTGVTSLDLTSYDNTDFKNFAGTKNDLMNQFMLELEAEQLAASDGGVTAWVVGTHGARHLANNPDAFSKLPGYSTKLNGLVGTYNDIPVLRHSSLTAKESAGEAPVIGLHKEADGRSAPVIYGEYLPVYSTKASVNFDNPTEFSQAMFSQSVAAECVPQYSVLGKIKFA